MENVNSVDITNSGVGAVQVSKNKHENFVSACAELNAQNHIPGKSVLISQPGREKVFILDTEIAHDEKEIDNEIDDIID